MVKRLVRFGRGGCAEDRQIFSSEKFVKERSVVFKERCAMKGKRISRKKWVPMEIRKVKLDPVYSTGSCCREVAGPQTRCVGGDPLKEYMNQSF